MLVFLSVCSLGCDRRVPLGLESTSRHDADLFGDRIVELFSVASAVHVRDDAILENKESRRRLDSEAISREVNRTRVFVAIDAHEAALFPVFTGALFKVRKELLARVARGEANLKDDSSTGALFFL